MTLSTEMHPTQSSLESNLALCIKAFKNKCDFDSTISFLRNEPKENTHDMSQKENTKTSFAIKDGKS